MSSPDPIIQRLQALKLWQEAEQEKLLQQQIAQRKLLISEQIRAYETLGISFSSDNSSIQISNSEYNLHNASGDSELKESHNEKDSVVLAIKGVTEITDSVNNDEVSISEIESLPLASLKPVETVHDDYGEKTSHTSITTDSCLDYNNDQKPIVKKPFLKRGTGLIRYRMNLSDCKLNNIPKYQFSKSKLNPVQKKTAKKSLFTAESTNKEKMCLDNHSQQTSTKDNFYEKSADRNKQPTEQPTSNSKEDDSEICSNDNFKSKQYWADALNKESVNKKLDDSLQNTKENQMQDSIELKLFELLEQKASNSSFCSTSSIVTKFLNNKSVSDPKTFNDIRLNSNAYQARVFKSKENELDNTIDTKDSDCDSTVHKLRVRFDDKIQIQSESDISMTDAYSYEDISSLTSSCTSTPNIKYPRYLDSSKSFEDTTNDSTLQSETILDNVRSALHFEINLPVKDNNDKVDVMHSNISEKQLINQQSNILKERLQELENEIEVFRKQNAALTRSKNEFEVKKITFEKQRKKVEQKLIEDKLQNDKYLIDEKQKLSDERKMFEKYISEIKKNPSRKEREEITALKEKILELQTEMRSKDAKSGATNARLRTQIKKLEADTEKQQKFIDELKEKNRKLLLANNQYRKSANKRMLQEIHSNLPHLLNEKVNTHEYKARLSLEANGFDLESANIKSGHNAYFSDSPSEDESREIPNKVTVLMIDKETMTDVETEQVTGQNLNGDNSDYLSFKKMQDYRAKCLERGVRNTLCNPNTNITDTYKENTETQRFNTYSTDLINSQNIHNMHNNFSKSSFKPYSIYYNSQNNFSVSNTEPSVDDINKSVQNDRQEIIHPDGRKEIWYSNGNVKKISPDGLIVKMIYFNGDCKEIFQASGIVKYFYATNRIWHTTFKDGSEVLEFPNGQTERRFMDGSTEIQFPDGSMRVTKSLDSSILDEWKYPDGSTLINKKNGDKMLCMPNGQREIHTKDHRRREFPDGTIKLVFPDGSQETRYANGRVRVKDSSGNLIKDSRIS